MSTPSLEALTKDPLILAEKKETDRPIIRGFSYVGGIALYNPDQDTLDARQILHITPIILGWSREKISNQLFGSTDKERWHIQGIHSALGMRGTSKRGNSLRVHILPVCLAAEILQIEETASDIDLGLSQHKMRIVADIASGQSRGEVAASRNISPQMLNQQLRIMRENTGALTFSLLELAAFLTGSLVMNPDPTQELLPTQMPVYRTANVTHNYQIADYL